MDRGKVAGPMVKDIHVAKSASEFIYTNLREANLHYANLREADLWGAKLTGANLSEAKFCRTTMPDGSTNNDDC